MRLAHVLLEQKYEAEDALRKINEGATFEEVARKSSKCPSAADGGDLGDVPLRRLDPDFAEAAEQLKPGEMSGIVRTRFGYHLIRRNA